MKKPRALIIDGNNLIYRCYYGLGYLSTPGGQVIHGAFGTIRRVKEALKLFQPDRMVVCWDGSQSYKSWRHDVFKPYKSRPKTEQNLLARTVVDEQILITMKVLGDDLLIPQVRGVKVEGDDSCSVAAAKFVADGYRPVIMSPDHDFIQLVDRDVTVYDPMKVIWFNLGNFEEESVHAKPKVSMKTPNEFLDWMIVNGDTGDGVPTVKGLGGAVRWSKWAPQIELPISMMLESQDAFRLNCPRGMQEKFLPRYEELHRNWVLLDLKYARDKVRRDVFEFWPRERHDFDAKQFVKSCNKYSFNSILAEMDEWERDINEYHERAKR